MIALSAYCFYFLAATIPAYFLTRPAKNIWWNLLPWLTGLVAELIAVLVMFLILVSAYPDAAPALIMIAITPPLRLLLFAPCVGIAAGYLPTQLRKISKKLRGLQSVIARSKATKQSRTRAP